MSGSEGQGLSQYVTVDETLPVMQETQPNTPDMTIRTQDVVDAISAGISSTFRSLAEDTLASGAGHVPTSTVVAATEAARVGGFREPPPRGAVPLRAADDQRRTIVNAVQELHVELREGRDRRLEDIEKLRADVNRKLDLQAQGIERLFRHLSDRVSQIEDLLSGPTTENNQPTGPEEDQRRAAGGGTPQVDRRDNNDREDAGAQAQNAGNATRDSVAEESGNEQGGGASSAAAKVRSTPARKGGRNITYTQFEEMGRAWADAAEAATANGKTPCPVLACSKRVDAKRSAMRDHLLGHLNDPTRMPYKCSERNCFYACVRADAIRDHVKVCGKNKRKKWTAEEENAIKNACKVPENLRAANAIFGVTPKQSGAPADETDDENLVAQGIPVDD